MASVGESKVLRRMAFLPLDALVVFYGLFWYTLVDLVHQKSQSSTHSLVTWADQAHGYTLGLLLVKNPLLWGIILAVISAVVALAMLVSPVSPWRVFTFLVFRRREGTPGHIQRRKLYLVWFGIGMGLTWLYTVVDRWLVHQLGDSLSRQSLQWPNFLTSWHSYSLLWTFNKPVWVLATVMGAMTIANVVLLLPRPWKNRSNSSADDKKYWH